MATEDNDPPDGTGNHEHLRQEVSRLLAENRILRQQDGTDDLGPLWPKIRRLIDELLEPLRQEKRQRLQEESLRRQAEIRGRPICRWRERLSLNQVQAAELLGVTVRTLRRWEKGEGRHPTWLPTAMRYRGLLHDELQAIRLSPENRELLRAAWAAGRKDYDPDRDDAGFDDFRQHVHPYLHRLYQVAPTIFSSLDEMSLGGIAAIQDALERGVL